MTERGRGNKMNALPRGDSRRIVLSYAALPDAVVAFSLMDGRLQAVRLAVTGDSLGALVDEFARQLRESSSNAASLRSTSTALYDLLIAPFSSRLSNAGELTVVADAPLDRIAWAALADDRGKYLVERLPIERANAVRDGHADIPIDVPALVVGNPAFDAHLFPDVAPLLGADRETRLVARHYGRGQTLSGKQATKSAVVAALRSAHAFHFAGHARLIDRAPELSHLVLAHVPGALEENSLSAAEIERMDLHRLSVVVLSSCGTAQQHTARDETARGLSDAFLDAGAGAVISSLWEVPDAPTADLMEDVSRHLAARESPAVALRRAQVAAIQRSRATVAAWAAFIVETR
jgi:CHAT domain-containing protein